MSRQRWGVSDLTAETARKIIQVMASPRRAGGRGYSATAMTGYERARRGGLGHDRLSGTTHPLTSNPIESLISIAQRNQPQINDARGQAIADGEI